MRGLALSGGGFRATLFHLGVIRYLYELERYEPESRALSGITHITSVSGGSIIAAHLVLSWEQYLSDFDSAAVKLITCVQKDIRGRIVRRIPRNFPTFLSSLLIQRVSKLDDTFIDRKTRVSPTDSLERAYSKYLFGNAILKDLHAPNRPVLYLLTTNLADCKQAAYTSRGLELASRIQRVNCEDEPLSRAVAASSSFPGMFPPVSQKITGERQILKLLDGGVYDNLGVRKFEELLNHEKIQSVIVSDASPRFNATAPHGLLEPLKTPLRAADVLFQRVYEIDSALAKKTDVQSSCQFSFLSLRSEVDPLSDKFALPKSSHDELVGIRTDLDVFSDLEISALVRHGFCVANRNLKKEGALFTSEEDYQIWNPVPASKDKFAKALFAQDRKMPLKRINNRLAKGSNRKLRVFARHDLVSYLNVVTLLIICGFFMFPTLVYLLRGPGPVDPQIEALKGKYRTLIWDRRAETSEWAAISSDPIKPGQTDLPSSYLETWSTSQSVYAFLKSGPLEEGQSAFLIHSLESRFHSPDFVPEVGGWYTRPSVQALQAEPALWTLAAVCVLLQRTDLNEQKRVELIKFAEQVVSYLENNHYVNRSGLNLSFNVLANQTPSGGSSAYTTSIALLTLIEMKKARLTWNNRSANEMIESILRWFASRYRMDEPQGWKALDSDRNSDQSEPVTLQILAISLEAYNELQIPIPDEFRQRVEKHLFEISTRQPVDTIGTANLTVTNSDGFPKGQYVSINFLWKPWAVRLCRVWLKTQSNLSSTDNKRSALKTISDLLITLEASYEFDKSKLTFYSAEILIGLS